MRKEVAQVKSGRRILGMATNLLFVFSLFVLLGITGSYYYLQAKGWSFYVIATGSMTPTLNKGDVVAVKKIAPHKIKAGDVVAFRKSGLAVPIVHRVAAVESSPDVRNVYQDRDGNFVGSRFIWSPRTFYTKGDANPERDDWTTSQEKLVGIEKRVVPGLPGLLIRFLNRGLLLQIGLLFLGSFIVWEVIDILKGEKGKKQALPAASSTQLNGPHA
jgi:signal peptidase I